MTREHLGEMRRRIEANAVLTFAVRTTTAPRRADGQHAGERVERAFVTDHGVVIGKPPVAGQEAPHDTVAIPPVPDQDASWLEDARPLGHDALIITRQEKEAKGGEEIHHGVEPCGPFRRKAPHVATRVAERFPKSPCLSAGKQLTRQIEPVDVVPCLGEEVCVAALAARDVEDTRSGGEAKQIDQPSSLATVTREVEDRAVLEEIVGVEVLGPPVALRAGTGNREPGTEAPRSFCSRFPVPRSQSPL